MIDHIEGWLRLNKTMKDLYDATLKCDYARARALCAEIATDARLVAAQLSIEEEGHGTHRSGPNQV